MISDLQEIAAEQMCKPHRKKGSNELCHDLKGCD